MRGVLTLPLVLLVGAAGAGGSVAEECIVRVCAAPAAGSVMGEGPAAAVTTLTAAQHAARHRAADTACEVVQVSLCAEEVHMLDQPLVLTAADSHTRWRTAGILLCNLLPYSSIDFRLKIDDFLIKNDDLFCRKQLSERHNLGVDPSHRVGRSARPGPERVQRSGTGRSGRTHPNRSGNAARVGGEKRRWPACAPAADHAGGDGFHFQKRMNFVSNPMNAV